MTLEKFSVSISIPNIGKDPPTEVRLFHWGLNETEKGPVFFTKEGAKQLLAKYRKRGNAVIFDTEHKTLDDKAPVKEKKAGGYYLLELRADGLWAIAIRWVSKVAEEIRNGEWGWISPAIWKDRFNRVVDLISSAITSQPATHRAIPLLLSRNGEMLEMASMENVTEMMNDNETLRSQIKPLRQLLGLTGACLNVAQEAISTYKDGPVYETAQKMMAALPDWLKELGEAIEKMDPKGSEELEESGEEKMNQLESYEDDEQGINLSMKEKPMLNQQFNSLYALCQKITGETDIEKISGRLRAYKSNEKLMLEKLSQVEKNEKVNLVEKAISDGVIPPGERDEFLSLSRKELNAFLASATPLMVYENVSEKSQKMEALKAKNAPDESVPDFYANDTKEIFAKVEN